MLNWVTALLVPCAWPVGLWIYRYRGAPIGEFRLLARTVTLLVLSWRPSVATVGSFVPALARRFVCAHDTASLRLYTR